MEKCQKNVIRRRNGGRSIKIQSRGLLRCVGHSSKGKKQCNFDKQRNIT